MSAAPRDAATLLWRGPHREKSGYMRLGAERFPSADYFVVVCISGHSRHRRWCMIAAMKDLMEKLEKLRTEAEDCTLISRLAADKAKRQTFAELADKLRHIAAELERVIAAGESGT